MQFWLLRGFGAVGGAGAGSYSFWFYGGMHSPAESVSQGGIYLGQVVCYSQTVVCNRSTVRAV